MKYALSSRRLCASVFATVLVLGLAAGCASDGASGGPATDAVADSDVRLFETEDYAIQVATLAEGLTYPYSLAFLPDGTMLLTELEGRLRYVRNGMLDAEPIAGVPDVYYVPGRGGLMDVILHPDYEENHWIYFTYDKAGELGARHSLHRQ